MSSRHLIVDNGSYEIKMGYAGSDATPIKYKNCIARSKNKQLLIGDQVDDSRDITGMYFKRPFEKGHLTSWETEKPIWDYGLFSSQTNLDVDPSDTGLVLTESPFHLPQLSIATDQIIFEEYAFESYYRATAASFVPWNSKNDELLQLSDTDISKKSGGYCDFSLIVDSGFNCTWIVPVLYGVVYWPAVRKLPIGGRFLSGYLRELISFRYYDVTDETVLVNNIKESVCYMADNFSNSLETTHLFKSNPKKFTNTEKNNIVSEYVLPDYKTTTTGYLLTEDIKSRLGDRYQDLQSLKLCDERFSVPETLFHPEIAGVKKTGIIKTIVESINECPELVRPLLVSNIFLVGGNFNIPGVEQRLASELQKELPIHWEVRVGCSEQPDIYEWQSANDLVESGQIDKVAITKKEYFENGANYCQRRFGYKV